MTPGGLVIVRGGGDLGTGVAHRLAVAGYRVAVLEVSAPRVVRRTVAFAEAVRTGEVEVEGVSARMTSLEELARLDGRGEGSQRRGWPDWVPVVVDPHGEAIRLLRPDAVVDARMAKRNLGTRRDDAPVTIGLGPGFVAGSDVDVVVETKRGHTLGRVIVSGAAEPNTGVPGEVAGFSAERVMRAPAAGRFVAARSIGDLVRAGDSVGTVGGVAVRAQIDGLLRGLVASGVELSAGDKVGDVDPRGTAVDPTVISDKARAIGGGVLEALLGRGILPGLRTAAEE